MDFDEALTYLLGLGHETLAMKLGLEGTGRLLDALGRPQEAYARVQIAGTNGKGSTAAMLDSVCRAAGLRAGLYTSPHLVSITERVRVAGAEISPREFARAATLVRAAAEEVGRAAGALPTFFEQVTALALVAFREAGVELAILETGLGGRLDATTAAGASVVGLTPVALDHQEYLGQTLREIAAEKAAVVRRGTTAAAVVSAQEPEAEAVILARCRECGVEPRRTDGRLRVEGVTADGRAVVTLDALGERRAGVRLALRGRHQVENAAVAVALAEALGERGLPVTPEAIARGLESAEHPGRLELREGAPAVLLDGAHNPAGARALREYLDEFVRPPVTLVFGAMREKDAGEVGRLLFPAARRLVLTEAESPRSARAEELVRAIPREAVLSTISLAPRARDALTIARSITPADGTVCVTGSLYLVGEVKKLLEGGPAAGRPPAV